MKVNGTTTATSPWRLRTALWASEQLSGQLAQTLPRPRDFADAMTLVSPDAVAETIACGPDADRHAAKVEAYATHASTTSTSS